MVEILIIIVIVSILTVSGVSMLLAYRAMSGRTLVATNLLSARVAVEEIIRNTNRISPSEIERRINEVTDYPGFGDVTVVSVAHNYPFEEMKKLMLFEVQLKDGRIGREEIFYVYRYDPYAEQEE